MIEVAGEMREREALPAACASVRDIIYAEAEGEGLSQTEVSLLATHLAGCAACAAEQRRVKSFTTSISDMLKTLKPDLGLRRKVLAKIETKRDRRQLGKAAAALAAAVALAVVVFLASGEKPVATLRAVGGGIRVLRADGSAAGEPADGQALMNGTRLQLADGQAASVDARQCDVRLVGPALVQLERVNAHVFRVHVLKRSTLKARAAPDAWAEVRVGSVDVRAAGAHVEVAADAAGACTVWVLDGRAEVTWPAGRRVLEATSSLRVDQAGVVSER